MKKFISFILFISLFSNIVLADTNCDWTTIKTLPDGGFEYSPALNICVGQLVQTNQIQTQQIADLTKAIQLKDLALTNADARIQLWETSADNELDRLNKIQSDQKKSDWLMFGLGALTVLGAGYMAARLVRN